MNLRIYGIEVWKAAAFLLESDDGMILVDTGFPGNEQRILRKMRELGRDDLRLIFITHAHLDHYGSAAILRRLTGAPIAIHQADAEDMRQGNTRLGSARWPGTLIKAMQPLWERFPKLKAEPAAPDIILHDEDDLSRYGMEAVVIHTPGHTPGSSCLFIQQSALFVGDLLSGTKKAPCPQFLYADDWASLPSSVSRVQQLQLCWFYIGHSKWPREGEALQRLG